MVQNTIPNNSGDVAGRIAQAALAKRVPERSREVRRLLDAGLEVIRRCGTSSSPRVADIVTAAGLSNDAFYRYFGSKDIFIAAILEDGTARLSSYLAHQMAKHPDPDEQVRCWVEGILAQAIDPEVAATTLAVFMNARKAEVTAGPGPPSASSALSDLLIEALGQLGSPDPVLDAALVAHAVVGRLSDHLWERSAPSEAEIDRVVSSCLAIARSAA
jgi:AcrR family transcriptional regulator